MAETEDKLTKKERKKEQKKEREAQRQAELRKQSQKKVASWTAVLLALAAVIAGISYGAQRSAAVTPGRQVANLGQDHMQPGDDPAEYNSTPPTSGPHTTSDSWGIHDEPVPYEKQIHNLEHGGIIVHYNPDKIQNLEELTELFGELNQKYDKSMLVPDSDIETVYAVTGWTWIDSFDDYDAERIRLFFEKRYRKAPEPNAA